MYWETQNFKYRIQPWSGVLMPSCNIVDRVSCCSQAGMRGLVWCWLLTGWHERFCLVLVKSLAEGLWFTTVFQLWHAWMLSAFKSVLCWAVRFVECVCHLDKEYQMSQWQFALACGGCHGCFLRFFLITDLHLCLITCKYCWLHLDQDSAFCYCMMLWAASKILSAKSSEYCNQPGSKFVELTVVSPSLGHVPRVLGQAMSDACVSLPKWPGACIQVFPRLCQPGFAVQLSTSLTPYTDLHSCTCS